MLKVVINILLDRKSRTLVTVLGVAVAFFLSAAQVGLLVGWCKTISALVNHARADLWVMAPRTPAFDYGTAISRNLVYRARSVEGIAWAEGLYVDWNYWQRPDGRRLNVQLIGLDHALVGGPWDMAAGDLESVHRPETVVIDELYLEMLGVGGVGEEAEMLGRRARIGGVSRGVRTFTAAPFVFASLKSAIRFDQRYRPDEVTYVVARIGPGVDVHQAKKDLAAVMPEAEVLSSTDFAQRSIAYWMLETGLGITVIVTAVLGLIVGVVVTSQTLFGITHDHLGDYATLAALGFGRLKVAALVTAQAAVLVLAGVGLGAAGFFHAASLSQETPMPLEMDLGAFLLLAGIFLVSSLLACGISVREVFRVDPLLVFRN